MTTRMTNSGNLLVSQQGLSWFQSQQGIFHRLANDEEVKHLESVLPVVYSTGFKILSFDYIKAKVISSLSAEEFETIGIYGFQMYGPYSEFSLEMRENSNTNYADRLFSIPSSLVCWVQDYLEGRYIPADVELGLRYYGI